MRHALVKLNESTKHVLLLSGLPYGIILVISSALTLFCGWGLLSSTKAGRTITEGVETMNENLGTISADFKKRMDSGKDFGTSDEAVPVDEEEGNASYYVEESAGTYVLSSQTVVVQVMIPKSNSFQFV